MSLTSSCKAFIKSSFSDSDNNNDSSSPEDDLAKNELLKEEIIGRLINPQNANDQKFAEENMIDYFTLLAGQTFNNKRNEIAPKQAETKSTTSGMTAEEIIKKFSTN